MSLLTICSFDMDVVCSCVNCVVDVSFSKKDCKCLLQICPVVSLIEVRHRAGLNQRECCQVLFVQESDKGL
jgi:hypothetical protein